MIEAEREAQTRLLGMQARDEMCSLDAGSVGEQACKIDRRELLRLLNEARTEIADKQRTFDLIWNAQQRAIKLWQEANPGNDLVWPDWAALTGWLLDQIASLKEANS